MQKLFEEKRLSFTENLFLRKKKNIFCLKKKQNRFYSKKPEEKQIF